VVHISVLRRLAPALVLVLSGCGMFGGMFGGGAPKQPCPSALVLRPLANTAMFAPGIDNPRPENVAFYGLLSDVDSKCKFTSEGVRMTLDVVVIGERGPAAQGGDAVDFDYFVAVVGPGDAILSKKPFPVHIVFAPDQRRAGVTDHIEELIPASAGNAELTLDLGFQQSPAAISFYKRFRGR
jgi:hypothetical protein